MKKKKQSLQSIEMKQNKESGKFELSSNTLNPLVPVVTTSLSTDEMTAKMLAQMQAAGLLPSSPLTAILNNPIPVDPQAMQDISNEIGGDMLGGDDTVNPHAPRELKIDVFEFLKQKHGHEINLTQPLPDDFGYEELIEHMEEFAVLNNSDIQMGIPDLPDAAFNKGLVMGIGQKLSEIINQDSDIVSDGDIIDDIVAYLTQQNLFTYKP